MPQGRQITPREHRDRSRRYRDVLRKSRWAKIRPL
jgi:hypothetical protein